MKTKITVVSLSIMVLFIITSCGYRNPYVYTGPDKTVYITSWKNRTSELQLDFQIYQSLLKWFQKSESFRIVKEKEGADLILAGEIISLDLPSLSYGANSTTREVKLKLQVRYVLKDLSSEKILFEEPGETRVEEYTITEDSSTSSTNEAKALETIIDELSQNIYLQTLAKLSRK